MTNTKSGDIIDFRFKYTEFLEISRRLEIHHSIFDKLWNLGQPIFDERIGTAGVSFDKIGQCINFTINPKFWVTLSKEQKDFVISHECLHVILYHGFRITALKGPDLQVANIALDLVVNHSLVNLFGFDREICDPDKKYCWVDTVITDRVIPDDQYFEYYYNIIKKEIEKNGGEGLKGPPMKGDGKGQPGSGQAGEGEPETVDNHEGLHSFNDKDFQEVLKEAMDAFESNDLTEFVKEQTEDIKQTCKQAGCEPGNVFRVMNIDKVIPKRKWETVIKRWASRYMVDRSIEQWADVSRRFAFLDNKELIIPTEKDVDDFEKRRIKVWFFQDTSGSCSHLAERFFKAAMSLPKDRFDVKMHCFDTKVYETDLVSKKLYGFGGTTFTCIENYIQNELNKKENSHYPLAVWVITDGYGDVVKPQFPEKWQWFLSEDYKHCIPKESPTHMLKDFE